MAVAGPESGALQTNPESKITRLLPHERTFVEGAMRLAARKRSEAQAAIGEANLNSGGDWAFDDLTTRAAAEEAVLTDATYQKLKDLHDQGMKNPIDYPAEDDAVVRPGTRVTYKTPRWEETVDVASVRIPGMPEDEDNGVEVVSSESALGRRYSVLRLAVSLRGQRTVRENSKALLRASTKPVSANFTIVSSGIIQRST